MTELFDTTDYSPLFAGLPVPVEEHTPATRPTTDQLALCCVRCGGPGPYLRTRHGNLAQQAGHVCYACARNMQTNR